MKRNFDKLNELHTNGYVHIKSAIHISSKVYDEIIQHANKKARPIFNHNETRQKNDRKRRQVNLPTKKTFINNFTKKLNEYLTTNVNPNLVVSNWVAIHSLPNCGDQAAHCDFERSGRLLSVSNDCVPLSVLLALQPNTKLHVWTKSIHNPKCKVLKPITRQTVNIDAGDMIIFRGDLVHAGASYDTDNYRLHAYMDSEHVPRINNRTWLIDRHADEELKKAIII